MVRLLYKKKKKGSAQAKNSTEPNQRKILDPVPAHTHASPLLLFLSAIEVLIYVTLIIV